MTREELAEKLNGREYGADISDAEEQLAKDAGLVVVFGYSDDNVEFRGAIHDEHGCYDGDSVFDKDGFIPTWDEVKDSEDEAKEYFRRKTSAREIECLWCV